jgi:hypothetical protein
MREKMVMVVMHPRDRVWEALCERTCDLARYLDHIESSELNRTWRIRFAIRIVAQCKPLVCRSARMPNRAEAL